MIDTNRLYETAKEQGILLEKSQLEQLALYATLLVDWNTRINLTALTAPQDIEQKHFLDSLLFAANPEVQGRLVDVGTGAGFPGIVAKIYKPSLALTLMEPTGKRVRFLEDVVAQLGFEATIVKERAEEAARKGWRESFDIATARAVAALPVLCEYCLPLVRVGGTFIAMKGDVAEELAGAQAAIGKLGGGTARVSEYALPDGAARTLVFIPKKGPTPPLYPRNGGTIRKKPL